MYKLIAIDLDGTLLNSRSEIPERNKEAIKRAVEKGVMVCLCSGRSYLSLQYMEQELGLHVEPNYGIGFNGAMVYKTWDHGLLREVRLENSLAQSIIKELRPFGKDIVVYVRDRLFAETETELIRTYRQRSRIPLTIIDSFGDIKEDISKVLLRGANDALTEASAHIGKIVDGRCNQFLSEATLLEYTNLDANKGAAVTFLADYLGIGVESVIAMGDNFNDIAMIKAAGLGVAVANAVQEAKDSADYVTEADNNGGALAEIVERFID